uniref:Uncharacterized protein n=1 Tax=Plectus sambesii TaxID=2011161 RepID=A0A914VXE9_9BILA
MMRKAAAAALEKIFALSSRSKVAAQKDDKADTGAKRRASRENARKSRSFVRKPKARRRYISQVEYDTQLEKRAVGTKSESYVDYNGNVSIAKQSGELLRQLLEQGERVKQKSEEEGWEEDDNQSSDDYFDEDWSQQPDAP